MIGRRGDATLLVRREMISRYFEDFAVGQTYGSGRARIEGDRIKSFATEFDPQPFHLDDDAARNSIFRGLAASGWHTAALTMRLLVESELKPAGALSVPASMNFAGRTRYARETNCESRARSSRCARRSRVPSRG
jgi:acyl dehydratase